MSTHQLGGCSCLSCHQLFDMTNRLRNIYDICPHELEIPASYHNQRAKKIKNRKKKLWQIGVNSSSQYFYCIIFCWSNIINMFLPDIVHRRKHQVFRHYSGCHQWLSPYAGSKNVHRVACSLIHTDLEPWYMAPIHIERFRKAGYRNGNIALFWSPPLSPGSPAIL